MGTFSGGTKKVRRIKEKQLKLAVWSLAIQQNVKQQRAMCNTCI